MTRCSILRASAWLTLAALAATAPLGASANPVGIDSPNGGRVAVQMANYRGPGCEGTPTLAWGGNNSCQVHGDGTGSTLFSCSPSGSIDLLFFSDNACSGPQQGSRSFGPGECWSTTPPNGSDTLAARYRPKLPLLAAALDRTVVEREDDSERDQPSFTFYCVPPQLVPPSYPLPAVTTALTSFSNADCSWDGFTQQYTFALGKCSPMVQNDSGFYQPMFVLMSACAAGSASYELFADAACTQSVGAGTVPTACSNQTGPPHSWGAITCSL
jgi:hypothetical protein